MKTFFTLLLVVAAISLSLAQSPAMNFPARRVNFRILAGDSVNLSLNSNYELIEDSCAEVIRHGHYNARGRKFFGHFRDVSKANPGTVLSEGNYTQDGYKDGAFTAYYLNGQPESKGSFRNNKFDGHWDVYYDSGKPMLSFDADNDNIKIIDYYDPSGKKIIDNGKGTYSVNFESITWKGKLENGRPDGTWHAYKTNDVTQTPLVDEHFKKGVFQRGSGAIGEYTDASRIMLVNPDMLPYVHAEKMVISRISCSGSGYKRIIGAQYRNGWDDFSEKVKDALSPYIGRFNIAQYENKLQLTGYITKDGSITGLTPDINFNDQFIRGLIRQLYGLPSLVPATADGKPIEQKIVFNFIFHQGLYQFSYRPLPINQVDLQQSK